MTKKGDETPMVRKEKVQWIYFVSSGETRDGYVRNGRRKKRDLLKKRARGYPHKLEFENQIYC